MARPLVESGADIDGFAIGNASIAAAWRRFENAVWRKRQRLGAPALASFAALRRASAASGFFWK
jgi:hypothetical protein